MHSLKIQDLVVKTDDKIILNHFNLEINEGEIHAIMGPNGAGKSTLTKVIMGDSNYEIVSGKIILDEKEINELTTDQRARMGLFLGMQLPIEIDGVTNADFLTSALRSKEQDNFNLFKFIKELDATIEKLQMNKDMIHRGVNKDFSGGERKKNEIIQMYMLKPSMVILDEIDSGLDVDSLKIVGTNVSKYHEEKKPGILLITHYNRLLEYIKPDFIHIMKNGQIIKTGDYSLALQIEQMGYEQFGDTNE